MKKPDEQPLAESRKIIPETIPEERLDSVKTLLCRGLDRPTILQYSAEMKWEATPDQVDAWISAAMLELADDAGKIDTEAELGKAIARYNWLYMNAAKVQDFKTALAIQKEITKVLTLKVKAAAVAGAEGKAPAGQKFKLRIAK